MGTPRRRLRERIAGHLDSREIARAIYGAIVGLALVLALQVHPPSAGEAAAVLAGTALAIGLAELYSDIIASETSERHPVRAGDFRPMANQAAAVVFGAGFPAIFFLLAAAGAFSVDLAFNLSKWTGLGLICGYGFLAARLAGAGIGRAVVHSALVGLVAGALITLKALLH